MFFHIKEVISVDTRNENASEKIDDNDMEQIAGGVLYFAGTTIGNSSKNEADLKNITKNMDEKSSYT